MSPEQMQEQIEEAKKLTEVGVRNAETKVRDLDQKLRGMEADLREMRKDPRKKKEREILFGHYKQTEVELKQASAQLMLERKQQSNITKIIEHKTKSSRQKKMGSILAQLKLSDKRSVERDVHTRALATSRIGETVDVIADAESVDTDTVDKMFTLDEDENEGGNNVIARSLAEWDASEDLVELEHGMPDPPSGGGGQGHRLVRSPNSSSLSNIMSPVPANDVLLELHSVN